MLPPHLLQNLSPNACKVYLTLLSHSNPAQPAPIQLPLKTLSAVAALAPRTCTRALRELYAAQLLRRLPFRYHHPRSYQFLPIPQTAQPPQADLLNPSPHPTDRPPQATHSPTPAPAPKTPIQPPQATLLNQSPPATNPPPQATHPPPTYSRESFRRDFAQLTPDQKAEFFTILAAHIKVQSEVAGNTEPEALVR